RVPLWWAVPAGASIEDYDKAIELLSNSTQTVQSTFIDMGRMGKVPLKEFIGAALWQINKALYSPYKSVLKMGLLEGFINTADHLELPCEELKRLVLDATNPEDFPDPYMLMVDRIIAYYSDLSLDSVVELLRECFYIKAQTKITVGDLHDPRPDFKKKIMVSCVKKWKWDLKRVDRLNSYEEWRFDRVLELGEMLHNYLRETYIRLKDHLKKTESNEVMISDTDLAILGRRLWTFYSRSPDKVEILKNPFEDALPLESLSFYSHLDRVGNKRTWGILLGRVPNNYDCVADPKGLVLRKSGSLLEVLSWMVHNRVFDKTTSLNFIPTSVPVSLADIQWLLSDLVSFFPQIKISDIDNRSLLNEPIISGIYVMLNFTQAEWVKKLTEVGIFYRNTWSELFFMEVSPEKAVDQVMALINRDGQKSILSRGKVRINSLKGFYPTKVKHDFMSQLKKKVGLRLNLF
ncbi:MAG: class I adenylate cyclase, partial [Deltaproteobacteria bacterium]|nr:class I adenylate cyclase [Deltaproteobacteria bacterium]